MLAWSMQELLLEELASRAHSYMEAERRDEMDYKDVGTPMLFLHPLRFLSAGLQYLENAKLLLRKQSLAIFVHMERKYELYACVMQPLPYEIGQL